MSDIQNNRLYGLFLQWLDDYVVPDQDGKRKVSEAQLWAFLNAHILNDTTTITVEGTQISLLWSYLIGPDQNLRNSGTQYFVIRGHNT